MSAKFPRVGGYDHLADSLLNQVRRKQIERSECFTVHILDNLPKQRNNCLSYDDKDNDKDFICMHDQIFKSGKYNFEGCKFSLNTHFNIDYFRFMLSDYPVSIP